MPKKKLMKNNSGYSVKGDVLTAVISGSGLGACIGLIAGFLLTPRRTYSSRSGASQKLSDWREMASKLSEQLQANGPGS